MNAWDPKNNLDLLMGGIQGLAQAPGIYRADQQAQADRARMEQERAAARQPVDASAVARKYAQMMEGGQLTAKQAAYLAQQEIQQAHSALGPQSLAPPQQQAPLPGTQSSMVGGLRGGTPAPSMAGGLRGPSLSAGDLALQRPPVTFSPTETKALSDYGIPQNYRARETARASAERLDVAERGRTERAAATEAGRTSRQEDTQQHQLELEGAKHGNRLEEIKARGKAALDALQTRLQGAMTKYGSNPKRREILQRIGQEQATLRTLYNRLIQDPRTVAMAEQIEGNVARLVAQLEGLDSQVVTEQRGPSVQTSTPRAAPSMNTSTPVQEPAPGWDATLESRLQELERKKAALGKKR